MISHDMSVTIRTLKMFKVVLELLPISIVLLADILLVVSTC